MTDDKPQKAYQATPPGDLEFQIVSPSVPKNEREWWAHHEIRRLREEVSAIASRARADALEEAAKVCEEHDRTCEEGSDCAYSCAAAIRALADD